jgi:hypothetical protein
MLCGIDNTLQDIPHVQTERGNIMHKSLHVGVNEILSFEKLVGNLDKVTVANLDRQHQRSLNFFSRVLEIIYIRLEL